MDYPTLKKGALFTGIPAQDLRQALEGVPHGIRRYSKGQVVFRLMSKATRVGVVLEGRVQAQKPFPNGSQVNVSVRGVGDLVGHAAAFSAAGRYPCDVVALEPSAILLFHKRDFLCLMQRDARILQSFTAEISTATYMLQQRLELLSYKGIAQKAAYYLLMQARQGETSEVRIPGSVTNWAQVMNVSRPSLHRELGRMEAQGIIRYTPPVIRILDTAALEDLLGQ